MGPILKNYIDRHFVCASAFPTKLNQKLNGAKALMEMKAENIKNEIFREF